MTKNALPFKFGKETYYLVKVDNISNPEFDKYEKELNSKNIVLIETIENKVPKTSCKKIPNIKVEKYIPLKDIQDWLNQLSP